MMDLLRFHSFITTTMTIPYSKLHDAQDDKAKHPPPSAPASSLMDEPSTSDAAIYMPYGSTTSTTHYDTESLLPIATPLMNIDNDVKDYSSTITPMAEVLGFDDEDVKRRFLRKVYGILAGQLLLTGAVCAWMILHAPTQQYVLTHAWPLYTSMALSVVLILALFCYKTQSPHNMVLLVLFTIVEAFLVGTVTTAYCASGYKGVVLEAVVLTCVVFVGLTLFTCQSKIDFSFLGAGLSMGLGVLILWGFGSLLFGFQGGYYYALFGCIIFSGYILFDTWLIMEKLSPHEYVLAAIMLYLDIINLFLYILRLLVESDRN